MDLDGKGQAFGLDWKRLGTAWTDGKMDAGSVGGPDSPRKPTGPYGAYGPNAGATSFGNETVRLGTSSQYGGAINSLVYDDKEYINSIDHGRQMQVAYSLASSGEMLMPTEAGNNRDHDGPTSTTVVKGVEAKDGSVTTTVNPAYWREPGKAAGGYNDPAARVTKNTTEVSEDTLSKTVATGVGGLFKCHPVRQPHPPDRAAPEHLRGDAHHIPARGVQSAHLRFDPATEEMRAYPRVHSELDPNGPNTQGLQGRGRQRVAHRLHTGRQARHGHLVSGRGVHGLAYRIHQFDFGNVGGDTRYNASKMGVTFGIGNDVPQDIDTRTYGIAGSEDEVKARLAELYQQNPTGVRGV
ncbi:hypothetical protein JY651_40320 [Pyxidicoccus parkwayensis]|uniref:Uncharacterized protein n=1 Tax=Pyxidicoccus parkwayensis TaxID=2813578 RepID=A0ABX7NV54_9BACT|nr:hypothetical protein [Pyxidicoccus parkwaysis]QSQ21370.1 hypothetical protein JY651_40320 [Pyxidicoccus parkwaysis]